MMISSPDLNTNFSLRLNLSIDWVAFPNKPNLLAVPHVGLWFGAMGLSPSLMPPLIGLGSSIWLPTNMDQAWCVSHLFLASPLVNGLS